MKRNAMNSMMPSLLILLIILATVSCSSSNDGKGKCGDGICDQAEQANPDLCPQDCLQQPPAGAVPGDEPQSGGSWSARVVWDCDVDYGDGQIDRWSVEIKYDFDISVDGKITGSGQGKSTRAECERPNCTCSLAIDDFTVDISGLQQEEYFSIQMTPRYNMQQCMDGAGTCPGCFPIQQLQGCGCIGGPLDVTIEAQNGAIRSFECNPDLLSPAIAHGNTVLTKK